jgi:hypothetical protein
MRYELVKLIPAHTTETIEVPMANGCIVANVNLSSVFNSSAHCAVEHKELDKVLWVSHGEGSYQTGREILDACTIVLKCVNDTDMQQTMGVSCDIDERTA